MRPESVELIRRDYTANGGWETFLSFEDPEKDILIGLLRLRKCSEEGTFRPELVATPEGGASIVRELHVYGTAVPVHGRDPTKFQHQVCPPVLGVESGRALKTDKTHFLSRVSGHCSWRRQSASPVRNTVASSWSSFQVRIMRHAL